VVVEWAMPDELSAFAWGFALGAAVLVAALVLLISGFGLDVSPLLVLALYVCSPAIDPRLAASSAFVSVGATIIAMPRRLSGALANPGVFLLAFASYLATIAP